MREVAEEAGVAMSSVSRVLSGHPDVSPAMRTRVLEAVEKLGYQPNLLAQSLRRQESLSVGFVVRDIANPLMSEIVMAAETRLREAGYSMLLTNSESNAALDEAHIRLFEQRRVDGLLLSLTSETNPGTNSLLANLDIPCVLIDRDVPHSVRASRVLYNHEIGVRAAVAHLLGLGHRDIGMITGAPVRASRERERALVAEFADRGLPSTYRVVQAGDFDAEHGRRAMAELLDAPDPPTAVIVGANQMVPGALRAIIERGLKLPRDLSLVSCDNIDITEFYDPPISVVGRDNTTVGSVAADLLLGMMQHDEEPCDVVLTTDYTPRESCGPPRA
jgi:LacI family transcriptional regulator